MAILTRLQPAVNPLRRDWTEKQIAAALCRQVFKKNSVVLVPNCNWTGHECDVLVVTRDLRVVDVEVKISRGDLRADAKKDKWFHYHDWRVDPLEDRDHPERRRRREWPRRVWKHYYAIPYHEWSDGLEAALPSEKSGVLLLWENESGLLCVTVRRAAQPCRDADRLTPADAVDVARLANLRLWDALDRLYALQEKERPK